MFYLNTAHGLKLLNIPEDMKQVTVKDFLSLYKIPYNSISIYKQNSNNDWIIHPCLDTPIDELISSNIMFRSDRNIDLFNQISKRTLIETVKDNSVSEYTFSNLSEDSANVLKRLSEKDCKEFVQKQVQKFLERGYLNFNLPVVLGISGGGDSNTLLEALISNGFPKDNLIPVMIKGIPDIDKGEKRAREICEENGLSLFIIEPEKVNQLLGRDGSDGNWAEDFEAIYPEGDLEMIGTLAVRLGLSYAKRKFNAQACITGLNLEDILGEGILSILQGEVPPKIPCRKFKNDTFLYPLYKIPKKVLDGCHPKLSFENYNERFPNNMHWRTVSYLVAEYLSVDIPGIEFKLVDGLEKMSNKYFDDSKYIEDEDFNFVVQSGITDETRRLWRKYIGRK